jgi:hypothetical protein
MCRPAGRPVQHNNISALWQCQIMNPVQSPISPFPPPLSSLPRLWPSPCLPPSCGKAAAPADGLAGCLRPYLVLVQPQHGNTAGHCNMAWLAHIPPKLCVRTQQVVQAFKQGRPTPHGLQLPHIHPQCSISVAMAAILCSAAGWAQSFARSCLCRALPVQPPTARQLAKRACQQL